MFEGVLRYIYRVGRGLDVLLDDGAGGAIWTPPRGWKAPLWQQLRAVPGLIKALGVRHFRQYAKRGKTVDGAQHRAHPSGPTGTSRRSAPIPVRRARVVGSALVRSGLERCDRRGEHVCPECLKHLVPCYQRSGSSSPARSRCRTKYPIRRRCGAPRAGDLGPQPRGGGPENRDGRRSEYMELEIGEPDRNGQAGVRIRPASRGGGCMFEVDEADWAAVGPLLDRVLAAIPGQAGDSVSERRDSSRYRRYPPHTRGVVTSCSREGPAWPDTLQKA
jgi:hypothetical protein